MLHRNVRDLLFEKDSMCLPKVSTHVSLHSNGSPGRLTRAKMFPYFTFVTHQAKRDLMEIVKSIAPGQPAQSTQGGHGQDFTLLADFLCVNLLSDNST